MNSSANESSQIKNYSVLMSSSLFEMRKALSKSDIPSILEKEKSTAIQNALDAQAQEIENLRRENQILSKTNNDNHYDYSFVSNKIIEFSQHLFNIFNGLITNQMNQFITFEDTVNNCLNKMSKSKQMYELKIKEYKELYEMNMNKSKQIYESNMLKSKELYESLKTEKEKLQKEKDSNSQLQNDEINSYKKMIQDQDSEIQKFQEELLKKNELILKLQNELNQFKKNSTSTISTSPIDNNEFQKVNKELSEYKIKVEEMKKESIDYVKQIDNKNAEIDSLKHLLSDSISNDKDIAINNLYKQIEKLNNTNQSLTENINVIKSQKEALEKSKSQLNDTNLSLLGKIEELESYISSHPNQENINDTNSLQKAESQVKQLQESIEKMKTQHSQQVYVLNNQIKETFKHSEDIKNQLVESNRQKSELERKLHSITSQFTVLQLNYNLNEKKLQDIENHYNHQDSMVKDLIQSKDSLNLNLTEIIKQFGNLKSRFNRICSTISRFFDIEISESDDVDDLDKITEKLHETMSKLSDSQHHTLINAQLERELKLVRQANDDLRIQKKKTEERLQSALERIQIITNQSADGSDIGSEIIKKLSEDFRLLNNEYTKLIEEHNQLNSKMLINEMNYKEIESKLNNEEKNNENLRKKTEKFDLYEFISMKFLNYLSALSSTLISSIIHNSGVQESISYIDDLLIQLKKNDFSVENAIQPWERFCEHVTDALLSFDPESKTQNYSNIREKHEKIQQLINDFFNTIFKKLSENEKKMNHLIFTTSNLNININFQSYPHKTPKAQIERKPLYDISLKTPASFKLKNKFSSKRNYPRMIQEPKLNQFV